MSDLYWPGAGDAWERIDPASAGFDAEKLIQATNFAVDNESVMDRDVQKALEDRLFNEPPPWGDIIGPTRPRGAPHGLVLRGGRIAAEWGDTDRPDITFSIAKSYLSLTAGLAIDDGLIPDPAAPVRALVDDGGFDSDQNAPITWEHLLTQTSEWEGELWSKPDLVDRNRDLSVRPSEQTDKGTFRELQAPGTHWEYNDVRVNRLALALLRVWKRPLPEIAKTRVMDPIGASNDWEWHGYENSWVEIEGERMQSVSGGSHWGGGMFISSRDQARTGLLMQRGGVWNGKRLISEDYIRRATAPCPVNPEYGWLWWLSPPGSVTPTTSYFAMGHGSNLIWIDPALDLVVVVRWIEKEAWDEFCRRLLDAMR